MSHNLGLLRIACKLIACPDVKVPAQCGDVWLKDQITVHQYDDNVSDFGSITDGISAHIFVNVFVCCTCASHRQNMQELLGDRWHNHSPDHNRFLEVPATLITGMKFKSHYLDQISKDHGSVCSSEHCSHQIYTAPHCDQL